MAVKKVTVHNPMSALQNTVTAVWDALATGDTSQPWAGGDYTDKTAHAWGDFTGGGNVTVQGSNDPRVLTDPTNAKWVSVKDDAGAALVFDGEGDNGVLVGNYYWNRLLVTGTIAAVVVGISGKRVT